MSQSYDFSFAIMNGECRLTEESICFTYDRNWNRLEQIFGKPSWRRSVLIALTVGIPLVGLSVACITFGLLQFMGFPLLFGLVLMFAPFFTLFAEEYSYPTIIARSAIKTVAGTPPVGMRLSTFTITFLSEGNDCKTAFCLPYCNHRERVESFQAVKDAFVRVGLMNDCSQH